MQSNVLVRKPAIATRMLSRPFLTLSLLIRVSPRVVLLLPMSLRLKVVETDALVASVFLNVIQFSLSRLLLLLYSMLVQ